MRSTILLACVLIVFTASAASWAALQDGLVAYYPFNGNAEDESGNGHNGTVHGATLTADNFGNADRAYSFDGNAYISVPDSDEFTLGTDPFTIAACIQVDPKMPIGGYYLMGQSDGPGDTNKWIIYTGDKVSFIDTYSGWIDLGSFSFNPDQWYQLTVRRDGDEIAAYVDAQLLGTSSITSNIQNHSVSFLIGAAEFSNPYYQSPRNFIGKIDEVRLYNRALSDSEIQLLGQQCIPEPVTLCTLGLGVLLLLSRRGNGKREAGIHR